MRENEKQTDDPVGLEVDLKVSEMGQAIGGGSKGLEGHGGPGPNHDTAIHSLPVHTYFTFTSVPPVFPSWTMVHVMPPPSALFVHK